MCQPAPDRPSYTIVLLLECWGAICTHTTDLMIDGLQLRGGRSVIQPRSPPRRAKDVQYALLFPKQAQAPNWSTLIRAMSFLK